VNPEQLAAFIAWADSVTQAIATCAEISMDRRTTAQARLDDLAKSHGFTLAADMRGYVPIDATPAGDPADIL
jgi:hypothetical protein